MNMRLDRRTFAGLVLGSFVAESGRARSSRKTDAAGAGRRFLASLFDPVLNLLPEHESARDYWIYDDNYLAARLLANTDGDIAGRIRRSMDGFGVERPGMIAVLFEDVDLALPFRIPRPTVLARLGGRVIRTNRPTKSKLRNWREYAELGFLAAIARSRLDVRAAKAEFLRTIQMWDGIGFEDPTFRRRNSYRTYEMALALIASQRLGIGFHEESAVRKKLGEMQAADGGWFPNYRRDGTPIGKANVKTTCLAIMALDDLEAAEPS